MNEVSVILLTYNHGQTIARAIESILSQRTNFVFVIHVLDDCSNDTTVDVCRNYAKKDPEKFVLHLNRQNLGVLRNLKNGLIDITAKYYALLEGDDYWCNSDKLQMQYDALQNNVDCAMCGHNVLYNNLQTGRQHTFVSSQENFSSGIYDLTKEIKIHTSARFVRNCIDLSEYPDYMMLDACMYLLYMNAGKLYYINEVMSVYNKTGEGYWSGRDRKERLLMMLEYRFFANRFYAFRYDDYFYKNSSLLNMLKIIFGKSLGWAIFYRLERLRIHVKYFKR